MKLIWIAKCRLLFQDFEAASLFIVVFSSERVVLVFLEYSPFLTLLDVSRESIEGTCNLPYLEWLRALFMVAPGHVLVAESFLSKSNLPLNGISHRGHGCDPVASSVSEMVLKFFD